MEEKKKVLILDDSEEVLNAIAEVLKCNNFEVIATQDIYSFYKILDDYNPDVVLIDYLLQGINGGDVCFHIKQSANKVPVIMMSAFPKTFVSLGDYGCDDFLSKPFDMDQLIEVIMKQIGHTYS